MIVINSLFFLFKEEGILVISQNFIEKMKEKYFILHGKGYIKTSPHK